MITIKLKFVGDLEKCISSSYIFGSWFWPNQLPKTYELEITSQRLHIYFSGQSDIPGIPGFIFRNSNIIWFILISNTKWIHFFFKLHFYHQLLERLLKQKQTNNGTRILITKIMKHYFFNDLSILVLILTYYIYIYELMFWIC